MTVFVGVGESKAKCGVLAVLALTFRFPSNPVRLSIATVSDSCASPESSNPLSLKKAAASLRERVA